MKGRALVEALRRAGIPVDALGSVTSGYLFVRTTGRFGKRANTYRWFAAGTSEESVAAFALPRADDDADNPVTADSAQGFVLPAAQPRVPTPVTYLRVWKELEQHARLAETQLHAKRLAYFRGLGPPPDALDRELVKRAWANANQCLLAAHDEMSFRASGRERQSGPRGPSAAGAPAPTSEPDPATRQ
ncbi:hypothetical protein [Variovorax paradoxus]|uniref:hypothetical protein n=1 Tax=Variovorax paradoxus TaxID=34073 RepID=UPI00278266D8|nr:hypothetical protein [Variovorax paradoxus]MDP9932109.1 hypothetical protein [Variovorax paradoxus]